MNYYIEPQAWEQIIAFLRSVKGLHTKNERDLRKFLEAVWYVARSGCQWRLLPCHYGDWRAVHRRFKRWAERGIWAGFLQHLAQNYDDESVMIDSTIIRAHPCAAGYKKGQQDQEALGRCKGGFTTKIHAVVDSLGQALRFIATPGQRHDVTQAFPLIEGFKGSNIIADKGYDATVLIEQIKKQDCFPVIPPRSNRKNPQNYDLHLYKERHLIECLFNKIKHFRRIFSRFDKTAGVFIAFLNFVAALIWMR